MKIIVALAVLVVLAQAVPLQNIRLIQTAPDASIWMTEEEILTKLIQKNINFMDVTDHPEIGTTLKATKHFAIPTAPTHQSVVNNLISQIRIANVQANLNTFTAFNNRYYTSTTGEQSSNWLFQTAKTYAGSNPNITVQQYQHTWLQKSVIARIPGSSSRADIVVLGAHQDSINGLSPVNGRAPGADDDGSGSVTLLEIFRILISSNFRPELTIEFHWYSAEEVGLRGSQDIASSYISRGTEVRAMMQIDMDGYDQKEKKIAIITDFTDATLNEFNRRLIEAYCTIGWVNSQCGYACSDHGSWNRLGVPASFPFEQQFSNINSAIHTAQDTVALVSYDHVEEFTRLGLSFAVELSYNN